MSSSSTNNTDNNITDLVAKQIASVQQATSSMTEDEKQKYFMLLRKQLHTLHASAMGNPARICPNVVDCITQTKLVKINKLFIDHPKTRGEVVAKLEYTNPGLSVKDRIARSMILDAQAEGIISPGRSIIIDITSGNTGVAYGLVAAALGFRAIQVIPEPYSIERRAMMMATGCQVVVSKKEDGIPGAIKIYNELLEKYASDGAWAPRQFDNASNIKAHFEHTGPEIWEQCDGRIDAIVCGYGTGGSISGITKYLRSKNPNFKAIAVEPLEQSHFHGDKPGPHGIQGIVPPFIPDNVLVEELDEVIRCSTKDAMETSRQLAKQEGILVGISSGANVWSACQVAQRPEFHGKRIVTILCSAAERYLSTPLYQQTMEVARNLPLATFDPETEVGNSITMNNLESIQTKGTKFRDGFKVV